MVLVLLGILGLLIIPAFGEILRQWNAKVGARPPLSGTHYGLQRHQGARVGKRSAAPEKSPEWRHFWLAGVIMLLDVGAAATEEPDNNGKRYAVSSRASPSAHCIRLAPIPIGEMNGQAHLFESPLLPVRREINIIYLITTLSLSELLPEILCKGLTANASCDNILS